MKRSIKKCISIFLAIISLAAVLTSCGTKLAGLFEMETLVYSYDKLSDGLLRIDYINVTKTYDDDGVKEEYEVYKTLSAEEQERILRRMDDIEFKEQFGTNFIEIRGEALVFCYTEYKLYISPSNIVKTFEEGYTNEAEEILKYNVRNNEEFLILMESLKDK